MRQYSELAKLTQLSDTITPYRYANSHPTTPTPYKYDHSYPAPSNSSVGKVVGTASNTNQGSSAAYTPFDNRYFETESTSFYDTSAGYRPSSRLGHKRDISHDYSRKTTIESMPSLASRFPDTHSNFSVNTFTTERSFMPHKPFIISKPKHFRLPHISRGTQYSHGDLTGRPFVINLNKQEINALFNVKSAKKSKYDPVPEPVPYLLFQIVYSFFIIVLGIPFILVSFIIVGFCFFLVYAVFAFSCRDWYYSCIRIWKKWTLIFYIYLEKYCPSVMGFEIFPSRATHLTAQYLSKCLDENGVIHEDLDVIKVGWRNLHHRVAGQTTFSGRATLELDDPSLPAIGLFVKFVNIDIEKRNLMYERKLAETELNFYLELSHHLHIRVPELIHHEYIPETGKYILLLEDIKIHNRYFRELKSRDVKIILKAMAHFHLQTWGKIDRWKLTNQFPWLLDMTSTNQGFRLWLLDSAICTKINRFVSDIHVVLHGDLHRDIINFLYFVAANGYTKTICQFIEKVGVPLTLIHGDFISNNLFIGPDEEIGFFDFQNLQINFHTMDLAKFVSNVPEQMYRIHEGEWLKYYYRHLKDKNYSYATFLECYSFSLGLNLLYYNHHLQFFKRNKMLTRALRDRVRNAYRILCDAMMQHNTWSLMRRLFDTDMEQSKSCKSCKDCSDMTVFMESSEIETTSLTSDLIFEDECMDTYSTDVSNSSEGIVQKFRAIE